MIKPLSIQVALVLMSSYAVLPLAQAQSANTTYSKQTKASQYSLSDLAGKDILDLPNSDDIATTTAKNTNAAIGLPEFVALSLQQSPQMRQARAQFETAEAREGVTRADLLPTASIRVARGPETSVSTVAQIPTTGTSKHTYKTKSFRLTQPLINVPAFKEFDSSRQSKDASALRLQSMREVTALNAARATIDLAVARITLNFSDAQLEQLNKILSYLEARTLAGASSQADLERARTRSLAARQTRLEQQTNYRNAMFEINRLTGLMPETLQLPFLQMLPALPEDKQQIRQLIKDQNYDLLALRKDVNAQKTTVAGEYSKYLPVLGASLEKDTTENVRGVNSSWTDTRALAVMTWNFSLGGREYYSAQQAAAELRNREAKLDDETQRISQATEADIALLQATSVRLEAAEAEQASALAVVEAVEEQLKSGRMGSLLEALDASDRLFGARFRLTQALGQQMKAHAQLLSRLGLLSEIQTHSKL
jgi:outer membrane protein TolC